MSKFSIAIITPEETPQLRHRIVESDDKESALKMFFKEEALEFYSDDDQGFDYFKEDLFTTDSTCGSIIEYD